MIEIFFFNVFSTTFFESCQKTTQKSDDISTMFLLSRFSTTGLFFNFSKEKERYAIVCALHFECKTFAKTTFSWSRITRMTNFRIKYTSLSETS